MVDGAEARRRGLFGNSQVRVAYLVPNLGDPAVDKRLRMLSAFGDEVAPIGFHRDDHSVEAVAGIAAIDLGRTFDADFRQRIAMVLRQAVNLSAWAPLLRNSDVVIARNLEMLLLGALARWRYAPQASLVYEALDIHRCLLSHSVLGRAARGLERRLLRTISLLIVSSPAFLRYYFEPTQKIHRLGALETLVVENKLLPAEGQVFPPRPVSAIPPAGPWSVGWFGMIRCRKSLDYLCDLAVRKPGLLRLSIRGRPSYTEFADFDAQIARTPGVSFGGTYRPAELGNLYGDVHFSWAIDFFEEGANSRWLLPNRIYEGGAYRAVPIAIDGTETAQWLRAIGIGVVLSSLDEFEHFLLTLTPQRYAQLQTASNAVPLRAFIADNSDCRRLLGALQRTQARLARSAAQGASIAVDLGEASKDVR